MKILYLLHSVLRVAQEWIALIWRNLAAFVVVADRRSFRASASDLGVTPWALSRSMRQLEERLGLRLLHRAARRLIGD